MHVIKLGFTLTVSQCAGRVASYVLHSHAGIKPRNGSVAPGLAAA